MRRQNSGGATEIDHEPPSKGLPTDLDLPRSGWKKLQTYSPKFGDLIVIYIPVP